jgi:hypothetical protein
MADRMRWQYCQIEVGINSSGMLKQFFADRLPVETDLQQNWPAMLAKLGEQGWEMVSAFPNEGGRGRSPMTYVFKRALGGSGGQVVPVSGGGSGGGTPPPEPPDRSGPVTDFEPLRGA